MEDQLKELEQTIIEARQTTLAKAKTILESKVSDELKIEALAQVVESCKDKMRSTFNGPFAQKI